MIEVKLATVLLMFLANTVFVGLMMRWAYDLGAAHGALHLKEQITEELAKMDASEEEREDQPC